MLASALSTIPAEIRDYPEWRRGRETYAVWALILEDESILENFNAARNHLSDYLLEPYRRQPHITLFVCGFLVDQPYYNDDFTIAQLQRQIQALEETDIEPFELEIGSLNSFASAPFLEVYDLQGGIARLREILSCGARELRTAPYTPHLTVGLYSAAFPSAEVRRWVEEFPRKTILSRVEHIALVTYRAQEIAGPLLHRHKFVLNHKR